MNLSRLLVVLPVALGSLALAMMKLVGAHRTQQRRLNHPTDWSDRNVRALVRRGYLLAGFFILLAIVLLLAAFDVEGPVLVIVGVLLAACWVGANFLGGGYWRSPPAK